MLFIYNFYFFYSKPKKGIEPIFYRHEWHVLTVKLFQLKVQRGGDLVP